jgi:hypothetical protein
MMFSDGHEACRNDSVTSAMQEVAVSLGLAMAFTYHAHEVVTHSAPVTDQRHWPFFDVY